MEQTDAYSRGATGLPAPLCHPARGRAKWVCPLSPQQDGWDPYGAVGALGGPSANLPPGYGRTGISAAIRLHPTPSSCPPAGGAASPAPQTQGWGSESPFRPHPQPSSQFWGACTLFFSKTGNLSPHDAGGAERPTGGCFPTSSQGDQAVSQAPSAGSTVSANSAPSQTRGEVPLLQSHQPH